MPNTITAFYEFSAGTKARSSEANTNFSNYRGTILPINENTASASDNSHDLGSDEHRWRSGYFGTSINLDGVTSTANIILQRTADTTGGYEILAGSGTITSHKPGEFGFQGLTTTQYTKVKYQAAGGPIDFLMGSTTLGTWSTTMGQKRSLIGPLEFTTSSSPVGFALMSGATSLSISMSGTTTIGTYRINTRGTGIVQVGMVNISVNYTGDAATSTDYWVPEFRVYRGATTTALTLTGSIQWAIAEDDIPIGGTPTRGQASGQWFYYDNSYSSGEVVYEIRCVGSGVGTSMSLTGNIFIHEL